MYCQVCAQVLGRTTTLAFWCLPKAVLRRMANKCFLVSVLLSTGRVRLVAENSWEPRVDT